MRQLLVDLIMASGVTSIEKGGSLFDPYMGMYIPATKVIKLDYWEIERVHGQENKDLAELWVLAHEWRHHQLGHSVEEYVRCSYADRLSIELDCNNYATNLMNELGIEVPESVLTTVKKYENEFDQVSTHEREGTYGKVI